VSGFVLTFHAQNVSGPTYETNDHVALDESIALLHRIGMPVLRALEVVRRLRRGVFGTLPERFVCLTFDDGTDFDWRDLPLGGQGRQPSMHAVLRKHSRRIAGPWWLRRFPATSFVIASPQARAEISQSAFQDPALMSDDWWRAAQSSGLMDIGSHGWDHVHPAVAAVRARPGLAEAFHSIRGGGDAQLQVEDSLAFIRAKAGGDAGRLFAYPYGQVSEFLATEHFPQQRETWGAFGCDPHPMEAGSDPWRLPRYVCGHDWKSNDDLLRLVAGA
jgi:peptidoglycan/xylan/chitin deacetylase (PgdA/CDA1 family)